MPGRISKGVNKPMLMRPTAWLGERGTGYRKQSRHRIIERPRSTLERGWWRHSRCVPSQVNISEECRERVLATDATAYDIFDEARAEVLAVLEVRGCDICFYTCIYIQSAPIVSVGGVLYFYLTNGMVCEERNIVLIHVVSLLLCCYE